MPTSDEVNEFLEHHGVKGMHWGIINEDKPTGRNRKEQKTNISEHEQRVLDAAGKFGLTEERARRLDLGSEKKDFDFQLTENEKDILKAALIGAGALAAVYGLNRLGARSFLNGYGNIKNLRNFWEAAGRVEYRDLRAVDISKLGTERVSLPKGSIIKRLSASPETEVSEYGFYAAFKDEDVTRYKGVMPVFWKRWGKSRNGAGYVINFRAKRPIEAPSEREAYQMYIKFLDTKDRAGYRYRNEVDPDVLARALGLPGTQHLSTEQLASRTFRQAADEWVNPSNNLTDGFFRYARDQGYNALIDPNDAGKFADMPLRIIDSSAVELIGHEPLGAAEIRAAQESLLAIAHAIFGKGGEMETIEVEEFLSHHGVKGQKWGIRNERQTTGQRGRKGPFASGPGHAKTASIQVDETPWSNYKESDYSTTQWHTACLIHNHPGAATAKNQCKLPIRTPSGVVNRHGVFAAAAVLAGSRGGVNATSEQKASARRKLRHIYGQIGAVAPPSLNHSDIDEFLEHYGVKGMHWGIRNENRRTILRGRRIKPQHTPAHDFEKIQALKHVPVWAMSDEDIRLVNNRLQLEQNYYRLNPGKVHQGRTAAKHILETVGIGVAAYNILTSPFGQGLVRLGKKAVVGR